jgi:flagellar assembly factor FliW
MMENSTKQSDLQALDIKPENIFTFQEGLPGFEKIKRFVILTHPEERPFGRLTALDFDVCFFVVDPWVIYPQYKPDISEEEIKKIENPTREETLILTIASIPKDDAHGATLNLAAPILINVKKGLGRQVVIKNFQEFSSRFPLWRENADSQPADK